MTSQEVKLDQVDRIVSQWERERPDLDVSPVEIFGRIARVDMLLGKCVNDFLVQHNLTLGLFDVLTALRRSGQPYKLKPSDLADMTMLTSGGITGRLDQLEELGFVERTSDAQDRRVIFAQLTQEGLSLIDTVIEGHFSREAEVLEEIDKLDRFELAGLLRKLEKALESKQ
jgi:DNA-binding MarR family transcriptional regulator